MAHVVIYHIPGHTRSQTVCRAMLAGITKVGDRVEWKSPLQYRRPEAEVAVFYGLVARLQRVLDDYSADPKRRAVYIDLGYWGRRDGGGRYNGFHKISVDGRHPTNYFQRRAHDSSRADVFELEPKPWRKDAGHILLCGMGPKGSAAEGYAPAEWERTVVGQLRRLTDRRIIYRPKPNWDLARPIPHTVYDSPRNKAELGAMLEGCHAVVSHHSNANAEALVAGVPSFTTAGVALPLSSDDLRQIEAPRLDGDRRQWVNDIAWTQWSVAEMEEGLPWRHLKNEGLVP